MESASEQVIKIINTYMHTYKKVHIKDERKIYTTFS